MVIFARARCVKTRESVLGKHIIPRHNSPFRRRDCTNYRSLNSHRNLSSIIPNSLSRNTTQTSYDADCAWKKYVSQEYL